MSKIFKSFLIGLLVFPFGASATELEQFNTKCTFLKNSISGTNTTGGQIIKADETAVHEFSIDLKTIEYCGLESCELANDEIIKSDGIILTSTTGSGGVPDEDGDIYELKEYFNLRNDVFTLRFSYFDEENGQEIGSSQIDYKCEISKFEQEEN